MPQPPPTLPLGATARDYLSTLHALLLLSTRADTPLHVLLSCRLFLSPFLFSSCPPLCLLLTLSFSLLQRRRFGRLVMCRLCLSVVGAWLLSVASSQNVSYPATAQPPLGVSGIISPSFAGFGIEASNLFAFSGGSTNNDLTTNLIANLANYTGSPPHFRIGGNTQDYMIYDDSMNEYVVEINPDPVGQGDYPTDSKIIGPRYFEAINRAFPNKTPITFGLNLAYTESDYIERITTMATQALSRLTDVDLVSFEIGNEPDLYLQNHFRSGAWTGTIYTQEWLARANAVWQQVLEPNGIPSDFFEPGCTASTISTTFEITDLNGDGVTVLANTSSQPYIASWNQHDYYYYIGVSTYPLTQYDFMTLSTTDDQFAAWAVQVQQAFATGYPYALREMGVVGPIGMYGITDVFAAALWTLNFFLYAASLNISSVQMHMTENSNASAWQPIEIYGNEPFVRPNYYAWAAFDQTIGASCQAQVSSYVFHDFPDGYGGRIAAYSVYQDSLLASVVLINSMPANISDEKNTLTFVLSLPTEFAGQELYLAYLTNTGADARHGTTWNGLSYEQSGDGTPTVVNSTVDILTIGDDGTVGVPVRDTQAVIANIGSPVGSRPLNESACAKFTSTRPNVKPITTATSSADPSSSTGSSTQTGSASSSKTGSSAKASSTNGAVSFSNMILGTLTSVFLTGFVLLCT